MNDNDDFDKGEARINHRWGTVIFFWSVKKRLEETVEQNYP